MSKTNGELTLLRKVIALIVIVSAIIGPYIIHDRAISRLQSDVTYIKKGIEEINLVVHQRLRADNESEKPADM